MIRGIEDLDTSLQRAVLGCIVQNFDMADDIDIEEVDEYIISINDIDYYVITDDDAQKILTTYNTGMWEDFCEGITSEQMVYMNRDAWMEDNAIDRFDEYLEQVLQYRVAESDYFGNYNFYEIH